MTEGLKERLTGLLAKATSVPWVWSQDGEKCDDPTIGIAYHPDDTDCETPLSGYLEDCDEDGEFIDYYVEPIALEIQSCDGASASANAALIVAAVNALPALLARIQELEKALERFVHFAPPLDNPLRDDLTIHGWHGLTWGDFRRARQLLSQHTSGGPPDRLQLDDYSGGPS